MRTFQLQSVRRVGRALLIAPLLLVGQSCTELTETPHDALTPENAFKTDPELLAGVAAVYAQLRPIDQEAGGGYVAIQELTTDVLIVPTRGQDWYDNGQWLDMHRQTWTANSAGSGFLNGVWNSMFSGVAKANLMIDVIQKANLSQARKDSVLAELRTLRAWYYYILQDMFGGAPPLVTTTELKQYPSSTRSELFQFIEKELTESAASLPVTRSAAEYGRVTKGAANAILASLYLNAGVFSKNTGVSATSYNSCAGVTVSGNRTACRAAIDAVDAILNSSAGYALESPWAKNFAHDNHTSRENIFVIVYTNEGSQGLGGNWALRTLHYNQLSTGWGSPWNGFATLAETYQQFEPTDERRGMWLAGQARSFETGQPVNDRTGDPLIFTPEIPDANNAKEGHGVRFNKFPPLPSAPTGNAMPSDFPFFRLSEMYLIRAEARLELGDAAGALADLKLVHDRRNPANPATTVSRDVILRERLLEFAGEGKRRTDRIRHGKFLDQWSTTMIGGKQDKRSETHRIVFPVPATQLAPNPNLRQNPGY